MGKNKAYFKRFQSSSAGGARERLTSLPESVLWFRTRINITHLSTG